MVYLLVSIRLYQPIQVKTRLKYIVLCHIVHKSANNKRFFPLKSANNAPLIRIGAIMVDCNNAFIGAILDKKMTLPIYSGENNSVRSVVMQITTI